MKKIRENLSDTLSQINVLADQVSSGSDQVSTGAQALSQGATEQVRQAKVLRLWQMRQQAVLLRLYRDRGGCIYRSAN